MSYLKSYAVSFFEVGKLLGFVYLVGSFLFGSDASIPFVYLTVLTSLGGPVGLMIGGKVNA